MHVVDGLHWSAFWMPETTDAGHAGTTAAHPGAALELVVAKLEQQLLTRKGRLISRSHPRRRVG